MSNNANEPINPMRGKMQGESDYKGLTKREYFAGLAMQGILATTESHVSVCSTAVAREAVQMADALLLELEK